MESPEAPRQEAVPSPRELLETIMESKGFPYSPRHYSAEQVESFKVRDRALVSLEYLGKLKVSDALRLRRRQVRVMEDEVGIEEIRLFSGTFLEYRPLLRLPLTSDRAPFTRLFLDHVETVSKPDSLLFSVPTRKDEVVEHGPQKPLAVRHAWEVIDILTGPYLRYFRSTCDDGST
jgi:hypothetical protein